MHLSRLCSPHPPYGSLLLSLVAASRPICNVYLNSGKIVPMDVNEISVLLNAQYNGGGHDLLGKTLAITANVRGAAARGRVRLQNAMRIVEGVGKPLLAR